jgi:hypothetical protein
MNATVPPAANELPNTPQQQENLPQREGESRAEIDLGLALLKLASLEGHELTCEDIAAWCNCSPSLIQQIEARALRKVRAAMRKTPEVCALLEELARQCGLRGQLD